MKQKTKRYTFQELVPSFLKKNDLISYFLCYQFQSSEIDFIYFITAYKICKISSSIAVVCRTFSVKYINRLSFYSCSIYCIGNIYLLYGSQYHTLVELYIFGNHVCDIEASTCILSTPNSNVCSSCTKR